MHRVTEPTRLGLPLLHGKEYLSFITSGTA